MIFSQTQQDFLKNLISFEIIDLQNQFVNCSKILKNLILNFRNSIRLDEILEERIEKDLYNYFISLLNFVQNGENFLEKPGLQNIIHKNDELIKLISENQINNNIINSNLISIKNFLKQSFEEKKRVKKILETALFLDLYDLLLRKFDLIYNPKLINKIAQKFNAKFHLDLFLPWILNKKNILKNQFFFQENNNIINNLGNHFENEKKFSEEFLTKIASFAENELIASQKNCLKFLKLNEMEINQKNHQNTQNALKNFFENQNHFMIFINKNSIEEIQIDIDNFYIQEMKKYYTSKI
jgi:hypothetical protein